MSLQSPASMLEGTARAVLQRLHAAIGDPPVRFVLAGVPVAGPPGETAVASVELQDARAVFALAADPTLAFGDLYCEGRLRVEGDLVALLTLLYETSASVDFWDRLLPRVITRGRQGAAPAKRSARHHYDVGNEFYKLWLDERMVYTCGYFPTPGATLEEAQLAKMELVCRKLGLRPGMEVVEAGAGWGALALYMAQHHGVRVRAFNVSHEQTLYAREQAEKQGLHDRVTFVEDDYRNVTGTCDAFASVGMLEHVGPRHYEELGWLVDRILAPAGLALIHSLGRPSPYPFNRWLRTRIFPNAHIPSLSEMTRIFEPPGFAVLDVENLRRHYERTTLHWLERYEANEPQLVELVGPERMRAWRLYLAGAVASFRTGDICLYQVLFTRARNDAIPWTRAAWYRNGCGEV